MSAAFDAEDFWRRIVPPLVTAFAVFLLLLRAALRRPEPAEPPPADIPWSAFFRYAVGTALSGYGMLLLIVLVFHVGLARDPGAFRSAAAGGAFLAFVVAVPLATLAEWVRRRPSASSGSD